MELEKFGTAGDIQELLAIREEIESLSSAHVQRDAAIPKLDVLDLGEAYQVIIEVPGVSQNDLEVAVQGRTLIIAGLREHSDNATFIVNERPSGHFERSVDLPSEVDREASSAHLQNGLLTLTLPKRD